jgi:hypothetical protein
MGIYHGDNGRRWRSPVTICIIPFDVWDDFQEVAREYGYDFAYVEADDWLKQNERHLLTNLSLNYS